jgi:uncharacterized membrane protein YkoI
MFLRFFRNSFFIAVLFMLWPGVLAAQDDVLGQMTPDGPKGRYSKEQGLELALQHVRGEVLSDDIIRNDDHTYYEYTIQVPDGSIYEVEMNADTGGLYKIEVVRLSEAPKLPVTLLGESYARALAVSLMDDKERGVSKPKVLKTDFGAYEKKFAYFFTVKKTPREAEIIIDAVDGDILSYERR